MIMKHQKRSIYGTYKKIFLKQLLKKTFEPTKENSNNEENLCLIDKVIIVICPIQSDGETYSYC